MNLPKTAFPASLRGLGGGLTLSPLLWTVRVAAALGFASLTLTGEINPIYLSLCWSTWVLSFWLDRHLELQERLRAWETAAVVVLISVFLLDFFRWGYSIFVSVAHFLMLFQLFKLLGMKARKDCLQILVFSFFQLLSACTLSVDAWQAIIFLLLIPIGTAGLFWQQISREDDDSGQSMPGAAYRPYRRLLVVMCLSAIPVNLVLTAAMFMIFPRLAFRGAFAGMGAGRSGYNDQVNLAQTGVLGTDNSAVLWLQISPVRDRSRWKGYLRGGTLNYFDGRRWSRSRMAVARTMYADTNGVFNITPRTGRKGLRQTITLVNTMGSTLFGSPYIGQIIAPLSTLQSLSDGSVRWSIGWRKPLRYEVISFEQSLEKDMRPYSDSQRSQSYLQLPAIPLNKTHDLVRRIAPQRSLFAQARGIERYLRDNYQYSLDLGTRLAANPVEDFLFVRRHGPCGHFASAMAVMLRLQGIPARVVAGYYKGTWNSRVEQYLIRERDAHAWVEAYFPEQGWVSFDPSPRAVNPPVPQQWLLRVRENWEYMNYHWNRLVIEYDLYSQVKVVEDIQNNTNRVNAWMSGWIDRNLMGFRRPGYEFSDANAAKKISLLPVFAGGIAVFLMTLIVATIRRKANTADPAILFYQKFLARMARKGFPKSPTETGWEYAHRLQQGSDPGVYNGSDLVLEITQRYYLARFASPAAASR